MEWIELEDAFLIIRNGKNIKQGKSGGYPITRIETISDRYVDEDKVGYADIYDITDYQDYLLKKGDILMSHINSPKHLGKVAIYKKDNILIHGMNLLCLRSDAEILNCFYAYYFFNSNLFLDQIFNITKHSVNQASFNITNLKKIKIPVPPLAIQEQIVEVLDRAQELIDKRKAQIQAMDSLIESIFYSMFGDPVRNEKGWEVKKLKTITNKIGSGSTPRGGESAYKKSGISLIRSMNVYDNKFQYRGLAFIDESQAEKLKNVKVYEDDILINITGASITRCCIVPKKILPAKVNQHVSILRCKENIDKLYLLHLIISNTFKQKIYKISTSGGATREALTKTDLENLEIPTPPLDLQNEFAQKVELIEREKERLEESLELMEENYRSIMDRAFKGELFN